MKKAANDLDSIIVLGTISYCFQVIEGVKDHPLISIDCDVGLYSSTNSEPFRGLISNFIDNYGIRIRRAL